MTAVILLICVIVLAFLALTGWAVAWWQAGVIARLAEARHTGSRPRGVFPAVRPGTRLLTPAEAAAHADAMHEISAPYLPGQHAQSWPRLTEQTVPVTETGDAPPWDTPTAAQPVLTQEMQDMRAEYIASRLREAEELTPEVMREAMTSAPDYGQKCTADVLAAEQRAKGLIA